MAIIIISGLAGYFLPLPDTYLGGATQAYVENPLLYSRANFDGNHYLTIAKRGYGYAQQAFFPLYPNLIRYFSKYMLPVTSGVAISMVSFFIAIIFLVKLVQLDDKDPNIAKWTVISLLAFPTSFFFGSVYTEGTFLMLIVLSFYCARTKHWWLAGIFGALASYTRFVGIFLLPALIFEWFETSKNKKDLIPILLIPLGLLTYMQFLDKTTGDPLAFVHVQKLFGQGRSEKLILLYQVFWRYVKMVLTVDLKNPIYPTLVLEFVTGIAFLWASIMVAIRQRRSYAVFAILSYLVPTLTGNLVSLPRYILTAFPFFIGYGRFLTQNKPRRQIILTISIVLAFIYLSMFVRGYWVS
ncbi:MAG: mannosyltransferase family protein [Candidatus Amesbacteria bacterium]|nr:mannosyltransferase family protein [Candidatus Amesbacteria bacterium]